MARSGQNCSPERMRLVELSASNPEHIVSTWWSVSFCQRGSVSVSGNSFLGRYCRSGACTSSKPSACANPTARAVNVFVADQQICSSSALCPVAYRSYSTVSCCTTIKLCRSDDVTPLTAGNIRSNEASFAESSGVIKRNKAS